MKILICGDYVVGNSLKVNDKKIFGEFIEIINESDIAIYNQEHPVTNSNEIYSTKRFGTTDACNPKFLKPILDSGFNYVSLSNNHIFNKGISGLMDTLEFFNNNNIKSFGAGENIFDAKKILYVNENNMSLALLSFSENEFNTANHKHGGTNPQDIIDNVKQIQEAKTKADFVFVIIHGGLEYCHYPTSRMVKQFRFYIDNGASAVICHHSHVVSGYETYKNSPIFYGIGNFIPAKPVKSFITKEAANHSLPVQFEISHDKKLKFKTYPLKFNRKTFQLEYLEGDELNLFLNLQNEVNSTLTNLELLNNKIHQHFLNKERQSYYFTLFTRSNYFLFKLLRKLKLINLYYWYIKRKMRLNEKNTASWNLHRCETHKDVLDLIYENHIDTYTNN